MSDVCVDVAILGAGPAGLSAACACREHGLSYVLLDRGGLAHSFYDYPHSLRFFSPPDEMEIGGVPLPVAGGEKPNREDYLAYFRTVVRARDIQLSTWESVESFTREADGTITLATRREPDGQPFRTIHAFAIVLAIGVWSEPITLSVPGSDAPHVRSEFHDPTRYMGHDVLVIGGGNSAVGAALSLMEARARVSLSMRRPPKDYRSGLRPFVKRDLDFAVDEGKLSLHAETIVTEIGPDSATLQPVCYTGTEDLWEGTMDDYEPAGEPFTVPCRFVFALLGHRADSPFLCEVLGLPLRPDGRPEVDLDTWETPVPNVFLAGSLADRTIDIVLKARTQAAGVVKTIARRLA
jgi:thioredoxin reductase (NADPH)